MPVNERKEVFDDIKGKLASKMGWEDIKPDQIFTLSTTDAALIQSGEPENQVVVGNFSILLKAITRLSLIGRGVALQRLCL